MITRVDVYNYIYNAITAVYPDMYIVGRYEPVPGELPAVCIREIGDFRNKENMTFGGQQGVRTSTVEVQIVSSKLNGSLSEAYDILDVVRAACFELFYNETNVVVVEDGGNGMNYRIRASYRRIIGDADPMPT